MKSRARIFGVATTCLSVVGFSAEVASGSVFDSLTITQPTGGERDGADIAIVDVTGIPSMDGLGSPNNIVIFLWIGPLNSVTGIGYDVVLQTVDPSSRRRDISMLITNTAFQPVPNFGFAPGFADPTPGGPTAYSRPLTKFASLGRPDVLAGLDGLIRLEFFDTPDHAPGAPDGLWVSGSFTFQTLNPIPAPFTAVPLALTGALIFRRNRPTPSSSLA